MSIVIDNANTHKFSKTNIIKFPPKTTADNSTNVFLRTNRFDIFINDENYGEGKISSKTKVLIEKLNKTNENSQEEIIEETIHAYLNMQKIILSAIDREYGQQEQFHRLSDERLYLADLLNSTESDIITLIEKKHSFSNYSENVLSRAWIEMELAIVNQRYDALLNPTADCVYGFFSPKMFNHYANRFAETTGLSSSALDAFSDDTFGRISARTAENFIEESNKNIDLLKKRSGEINGLINKYLKEQSQPRKSDNTKMLNYKKQVRALTNMLDESFIKINVI